MNFKPFAKAVNEQYLFMLSLGTELFSVSLDKDELYQHYLNSFPTGSNPIYIERTEHDCSCCKQFIRNVGNVITIKDGITYSIWDINLPEEPEYQVVADTMAAHIKLAAIDNVFRSELKQHGNEATKQILTDGSTKTWNHFHIELPNKLVISNGTILQYLGETRTDREMLEKGINEISPQACETVLELIAANNLYRGEEHKATVENILKLHAELSGTVSDKKLWVTSTKISKATRFKNSVIGTLLIDLTAGVDLDKAVKAFETKVAPANYKRPTALITQGMIDTANKTIIGLGLDDALHRRYARIDDITINNVLFADRSAKKLMATSLDVMKPTAKSKFSIDTISDEIGIEDFINSVLPSVSSLELMVENRHMGNTVSLIAPVHGDAANILSWNNNFSWSYNGNVTDSIKERVKAAGGAVDGFMRASLSWFNFDDLDIECHTPMGVIDFCNKRQSNGGQLDIDMNAGGDKSREAVENITWATPSNIKPGVYSVVVHNFSKRESVDVGFIVQFEFNGTTFEFDHPKAIGNRERVEIIRFKIDANLNMEIINQLPSSSLAPKSKEVWGIQTNEWTKVDTVMLSPNFWDDQQTGNKHWFFMLNQCVNPAQANGFYNEFLRPELVPHRKVFEVLASKLKTPVSQDQLSGVGFSSTVRNSIACRLDGKRVIKINF